MLERNIGGADIAFTISVNKRNRKNENYLNKKI